MARYLGIDLHRNRFTVCMIAENGRYYNKTVEMKDLRNLPDHYDRLMKLLLR